MSTDVSLTFGAVGEETDASQNWEGNRSWKLPGDVVEVPSLPVVRHESH